MELLMINLNQLKSALSDSKKYIAEYCDKLCNQVDITTLEKEEKLKSENKWTDELINELRENQGLMINEIKSFQNECLHKLDTDSKEFTDIKNKIPEIKSQIEKIIDRDDRKEIECIYSQIEWLLSETEQAIFNQKGLIFIPFHESIIVEELEEIQSICGLLLIIEDTFVKIE